ncbi:ABC transporter permease [Oculatella sp. LEGE 06141]|uniref:ABC transporter permease n=1 Tax=Oculatella sp. LEGE 06141 TaxID=1828648 RepID=UPI001880EA82|nr:ABC transporter permease [Oculatella sp. LEGE 06141]MBE9180733.1 ABC transporter permease [Oculatella sp. LEGE 06141]
MGVSLSRIGVIATNVFREVIRDRILYLVGFFALLLIAATALLPEVAAGNEAKITRDLGLAAISLLGLVIAVFVGTGLVNKEIEKRTVYVLIAKPISRIEFVVGKHLGLTAVLAVLILAMTAIYIGVLTAYQIAYPLSSILLASLYILLELALITAVAILFGVFTSSLLATLLTFAVYLMGHFSRDLVALGNLADNPTIQRVTQSLYLVLPDLSRFDLKNQAVYGVQLLPSPTELVGSAAYGLLYIVLLLAIAVAVFSRREF